MRETQIRAAEDCVHIATTRPLPGEVAAGNDVGVARLELEPIRSGGR